MPLRTELLAHTVIAPSTMLRHGFDPELHGRVADADALAEFAGRSCYTSFHRPNAKTAVNLDYIRHILDVGHLSVLEHASMTVFVTGASRSLTHELIRHRHGSYSQWSQRYIDERGNGTAIPPDYADDPVSADTVIAAHEQAKGQYAFLVERAEQRGLSHKRARQAARAVLPNATETQIVVTGNMRMWLEFLSKRWHVAADEEMQLLAGQVLDIVRDLAPSIFQQVPTTPHAPVKTLTREEAVAAFAEQGMTVSPAILDRMFGEVNA